MLHILRDFISVAHGCDGCRHDAGICIAGIIEGADGKLNSLAKATRDEIEVMLSRVLAK